MLLHVKIKPNQRFDGIERVDGQWVIRVKAPALEGKANDHLIRYLSEVLDVPGSSIIVTKGQTSRFKTLEINSPQAHVQSRLEQAMQR